MTNKIKDKDSKIRSIKNKKEDKKNIKEVRKEEIGKEIRKEKIGKEIRKEGEIKNKKTNKNIKTKNKNKNKKLLFTILIIIIIALIISTTLWIISYKKTNTRVVEDSDKVKVLYVGTFDNGTVFDTNIYSKALENNLDFKGKAYDPLEFRVGSQQVIPGFEQAVIGMKEGEKKTVRIEAKDAYGEQKEELISTINLSKNIPREAVISRFLDIPKKVLLSKNPGVKKGYVFTQEDTEYEVIGEDKNNFNVKMNPKIGSSIRMPTFGWPGIIKKINDKEVVIRQNPIIGETYNTQLAPVVVLGLTNKTISVKLSFKKGGLLKTAQGIGKVVNVTNDIAKIDFNNPIAGKALNFDITIVSIEKADNNLK